MDYLSALEDLRQYGLKVGGYSSGSANITNGLACLVLLDKDRGRYLSISFGDGKRGTEMERVTGVLVENCLNPLHPKRWRGLVADVQTEVEGLRAMMVEALQNASPKEDMDIPMELVD